MFKKRRILIIIVLVILSVALYIGIKYASIDYYLVAKSIPIYPTAIGPQVSGQSAEPLYPTRYGWITFQTNDSQENILNFYKDALAKKGWNFKETNVIPKSSDQSVFYNSTFEKTILFRTFKLTINQETTQSPFREKNAKFVFISIF